MGGRQDGRMPSSFERERLPLGSCVEDGELRTWAVGSDRKSTNGVTQHLLFLLWIILWNFTSVTAVSKVIPSLKTSAPQGCPISRIWAWVNWKQVCSPVRTGGITAERSMERNILCCSWGLYYRLWLAARISKVGCYLEGSLPALLILKAMGFDRVACSSL